MIAMKRRNGRGLIKLRHGSISFLCSINVKYIMKLYHSPSVELQDVVILCYVHSLELERGISTLINAGNRSFHQCRKRLLNLNYQDTYETGRWVLLIDADRG